jgi:uncharacterized protein
MNANSVSKFLGSIARGLIRGYQLFISPLLGKNCRFEPTCSGYALQAFEIHPPFTAFRLTVRRISRCHPWGGSGYDPVPESHRKCSHDLSTTSSE